jgi:hypothetical protein
MYMLNLVQTIIVFFIQPLYYMYDSYNKYKYIGQCEQTLVLYLHANKA